MLPSLEAGEEAGEGVTCCPHPDEAHRGYPEIYCLLCIAEGIEDPPPLPTGTEGGRDGGG